MANEKSRQKSKSAKPGAKPRGKGKPWHDSLYIVAGLFVLFMILYIAMRGQGPLTNSNQSQNSSLKAPRNMTGLEEFKLTLQKTGEIAVVQNFTGISGNQSQSVAMCAAGLAGSWGEIGGELSKLHIYAIEEGRCLYSTPILVNATGKLYVEKTIDQCVSEYKNMPYFYVSYGPSFSIFTSTSAEIYVDETFKGDCIFGIPEDTTQTK
jgi:hypothetical protein